MDKEELQKNIALYYSKLSPEAQKVFSDMMWLEKVKELSLRYSLDSAQTEKLSTEKMLVLLGLIHPEEYEDILRKELKLERTINKDLVIDLHNSILRPIRAQITETFQKNNEEETEDVDIEQKLDERFNKLSQEVKDAITKTGYHATIYEIAEDNNLTVAQIGALEETTTNTVLGNIPREKFDD